MGVDPDPRLAPGCVLVTLVFVVTLVAIAWLLYHNWR